MRIIGLTGVSGVGKDTLANELVKQGAVHCKLANSLRSIVYVLHGLDVNHIGDKQYEEQNNVTDLLIKANAVYKLYDPELIVKGLGYLLSHIPPDKDVVVSDVRQVNEMQYIQSLGGRVYRLHRAQPSRPERELDRLLDNEPLIELNLDREDYGRELFTPTLMFNRPTNHWYHNLSGWLGTPLTRQVITVMRHYHETTQSHC